MDTSPEAFRRDKLDDLDGSNPTVDRLFLAFCLAAVALFLGAYSNSLHNGFHFDDQSVIVDNLFIRDLANIPHFFTDARTFSSFPLNAVYRPLVSLTLAVNYSLGGNDPFWYHVTQLALFAATGAALLALYIKLFASAGMEDWYYWAALFAATLFCVHTGNTQTGNWIHARSELLSGLGVLGAFLIYIYRPSWRRYYLYLVPMLIGALAKTPTVMFAPLLLVYILLIERQLSLDEVFSPRTWPEVRSALISVAPAFVLAALLYLFVEGMAAPGMAYGGGGRLAYLATQCWMWVRYVRLFFVPSGLTADTDIELFTTWADPRVFAGILLLALSLVVMRRTSRTRELRPIAFGIAWFWIALIPASTIFPLAEVTNDYRMYFPFMGLTAAIVWWVCVYVARANLPEAVRARLPQLAVAAAAVILGAYAVATYQRNRVWLNEETLWADVVKKSPRNGRGLMNYGLTQMQLGRYAVAKDYFTRASALVPNYPLVYVNLGVVSNAMGDTAAADRSFTRALQLGPNYPDAHSFYGRYLAQHSRAPEAVAQLEQALALSPADLKARHQLLELYAASGDLTRLSKLVTETLGVALTDSLATQYSRTLLSQPSGTSKEWFERGIAATRANGHLTAAYDYRVALALDSANQDAWNSLGWSLFVLGFAEQAVPALERAAALNPSDPVPKNNLALVKRAVPAALFRRAFVLETTGKPAEAIPIYRGLLAQYPQWVNAHYNLGYALMVTESCPEAVQEFERTLAIQPNYPLAHLHLSECLAKLGRAAEAAQHRAAYDASHRNPDPLLQRGGRYR